MHEELDYELEADNTRAMARAHRGHPFIVIPDVIPEWCRAHVLVMDFVRGRSHAEIALLDQAERDRVAEMIFRCSSVDVPPPRLLRRSAPWQLDAARTTAGWRSSIRALQADR